MNFSVLLTSFLLVSSTFAALPEDLETTFNNLKTATSEKDVVQVKKLAAQAHALAAEAIAEAAPEGTAEEKDAWTKRVAYAKEVDTYSEYSLFSTALQAPAATTIDLLSTLEKQNPKSKYLDQAYPKYFVALQQTGAAAKIPAVAEAALGHFPNNEDLLLLMADNCMSKRQTDRALRYAERLVSVVSTHPKQDGMAAADWDRKKATALGRGYWISGVIYSEKTQYFKANQNLRASLPYVSGEMKGTALFYLGVANYQLGSQTRNRAQVLEAAKFSDEAAKLPGPHAQQAWTNAQVMRTEAAKIR